jgi:hypothetical protein
MHLIRYLTRKLLALFLDRTDSVDWKSIERCQVSAEPVKERQLKVR